MKFEYLLMAYIILVVGRFYWWAIQDEVQDRRRKGNRRTNRNLLPEPLQ